MPALPGHEAVRRHRLGELSRHETDFRLFGELRLIDPRAA
jgi:hypothetical protein